MRKCFWMLAAILACCITNVQAAEVSEALQKSVDNSTDNVAIYTFNYASVSVTGEPVVLSALLMAWSPKEPKETDAIETVHIYNHHTVMSNAECPTASDPSPIDITALTALVKGKYGLGPDDDEHFIGRSILIAPDYEGYGITKESPHPYLVQKLTARQVVDGVKYGLLLYKKEVDGQKALPFADKWRTFGFGYSQGGAVALAVQRYIEQNDTDNELHYRGTLAGDGPYDLLATMRYYMDDNGDSYGTETDHLKGTTNMPMVVPMIIKGMLDSHPDMKNHQLEDYLSQQFMDTGIMDWIASKEFKINDIHEKWYTQLQEGLEAHGRTYTKEQMAELFTSPKRNKVTGILSKMFTPELYAYMENADNFITVPEEKGDANKDLHRALYENGVAEDWEPQHRIQFIHSKGDMVVPYGNYFSFRDAHPDGEGTLYRIDDNYTSDHVDQGTMFFLNLTVLGQYGSCFKWLDEPFTPAGINNVAHRDEIVNDQWYDLNGRQLQGRPTQKGIYIHHARKFVIK